MIDLDDPASLRAADPSDALGALERIDEQWVEAMRRAQTAGELPTRHGITSIVYCGMGGSGIAGDALAAIVAERGGVPISVVKGYQLPAWVGPNTLVITASYSGGTEETLACFREAVAQKARLVVITTGGPLGAEAAATGVCSVRPVEGLQPRQAFVSLLIPILLVAERLQLIPSLTDEIAESEGVLFERAKLYGPDTPTEANEAKQIVRQLQGMIPVVWGQEGILAVAAERWRCQFNENAKLPAFSSVIPELGHNEIEGYAGGAASLSALAMVVLRGPQEHPRITASIDGTLAQLAGRVGAIIEARAVGSSSLPRLISAALLGDFASVYAALARGIDPTPIGAIASLKQHMSEEDGGWTST